MLVVFTVLIFSIIGTLRARQPDIDINRIKLIPKVGYHGRSPSFHSRRSISDHVKRHDYDHHSSRISELRPPLHLLDDAPPITEAKTGKVYQPREDPRLFYQSDAYFEETSRKNLNNDVSSIYLERGAVRAGDGTRRSLPIRLTATELNVIDQETCVRCPHDRTLIAKAGVDRAMLQYPRLLTCSGRKAPRAVQFTKMYGPEFGTLLKEGSHMVVGRITFKGEILQTCKMQIHVLLQSCPVPKYLMPHCETENKTCSFTCRDPKTELRGHASLTCGGDLRWSGRLPFCTARTWCSPLPPPDHGQVSCRGVQLTKPDGFGMAEGSICRMKCDIDWWSTKYHAVCRRGQWTRKLRCRPIRS